MLSWSVNTRSHLAIPSNKDVVSKIAPQHFQQLTNVLPSQISPIPSPINKLQTLGQKHPGVGVATPPKSRSRSKSRVTPMESISFTKVPSNRFRIYFFREHSGGGLCAHSLHLSAEATHSVANYSFTGQTPWHTRSTLEAEKPPKSAKSPVKSPDKSAASAPDRERIFDAFRRWGFYEATLDPIGLFQPQPHPDLALTGPVAEEARAIYSGNVGAESMHLPERDRREWIAEQLESAAAKPNQAKILERLIRADLFEQVLQARYLGAKRFSLEGVTSLIPLLDAILDVIGEHGALECVMAMSHRGRLNVMTHAACKPAHQVVSVLRMSIRAACSVPAT